MDLQTVLDWYRSALSAVMPDIAEWRVEQGVYWLPFSSGVGLCATSDGERVQVELCRGLSGESLLAVSHKLGSPFPAKEATRWVADCASRLLQEVGEVLKGFGVEIPIELGPPTSPAILIPSEARLLKHPVDASGWEVRKAPLFYESATELVQDHRVFPCGSVVVFLHRDHEAAFNLTANLIVGNQTRSVPTRNPLYYVTEADAPRLVGAMRRAGLPQAAIDTIRVQPDHATSDLGIFARDPQFVVVSLRDTVGTSRFDAHLREVIGTEDEERIPLYHVLFAEVPDQVDLAIKTICQVDTTPVISHMFFVEKPYRFRLVWSDSKIKPDKRPLRDTIHLPPFAL